MRMKYLLFLLYCSLISFTNSSELVNVGTVLFNEGDTYRKCWTNEQLALIRARFIYQDVLPKKCVITMDSDLFVSSLINYFRLAFKKVNTLTSDKTRRINMLAISDAIGGYFHHLVIPLAKQSFYSGYISYDSAQHIVNFYEEIKKYLKTDGKSWKAPLIVKPKRLKRAVPTGEFYKKPTTDCCTNLVYNCSGDDKLTVSMPFLDSKVHPAAIALPFKIHPLQSLISKDGEYILLKFYNTVLNCMNSRSSSTKSINKFKHDFKNFLDKQILPHVNDDVLFSGFGSVYKIHESLSSSKSPSPIAAVDSSNLKAMSKTENLVSEQETTVSEDENDYYNDEDNSSTVMFICLGIVIFIWLLSGLIYCCCRMRRKAKDKCVAPQPGGAKLRHQSSKSSKSSKSGSTSKPSEVPPKAFKSGTTANSKRTATTPNTSKTKGSNVKKKKSSVAKEECVRLNPDSKITKCKKCNMDPCKKPTTSYMVSGISYESQVRSMQKESTDTSQEKPVVFGYDFETSTSDSSSGEDESSSSSSPK